MPRIPTNEYGYFYDFRHINTDEISNYPNGIEDIRDRKIDGLIIRQVLKPEEVRNLLKHIEKQKADIRTKVPTGYTFPRAFYEAELSVNAGNTIEDNFREWEKWRAQFPEQFGIDIEKRINDIFRQMSGGKEVEVLPGPNGIGSYIPMTVRVYYPNMSGIPVHCENIIEDVLPQFYSHLKQKVITQSQMGYFIQLQTPQRGGELTIYDLEWKPGQMHVGETSIKLEDGRIIDTAVEGVIEKFFLKLQPGDMLIFAGGQIWHRVEKPLGTIDRITAGGFLGFTRDGKSLTYWS